jgi:hypothetical protein
MAASEAPLPSTPGLFQTMIRFRMDRHETLRQTPDFHAHRVRRPAHFSRQSPPRLDPETDNLVEIMEQWASYFGKCRVARRRWRR